MRTVNKRQPESSRSIWDTSIEHTHQHTNEIALDTFFTEDDSKVFSLRFFQFLDTTTTTTTAIKATTARELKRQFFSLAATSISAFISFLMFLFRFISAQIEMDFSICYVQCATSTSSLSHTHTHRHEMNGDCVRAVVRCDMVSIVDAGRVTCMVSFDHHRILTYFFPSFLSTYSNFSFTIAFQMPF